MNHNHPLLRFARTNALWAIGANLVSMLAFTGLISHVFALNMPAGFLSQVNQDSPSHNLVRAGMMSLPFLVPMLLMARYFRPVGRFLRETKGDPAAAPPDLVLRRVLNAPIAMGLVSAAGWGTAFLLVGALHVFLLAPIAPHLVAHTLLLDLVNYTLLSALCFVIVYYVLDFINRKRYIPRLFGDVHPSAVPGALHLSIRAKFLVYAFAIGFYPIFVLTSILFIARTHPQAVDIALLAIPLFVILAGVLTPLIARSFRDPLVEMRAAAEKIRAGAYATRVAVVSVDELGILGEGLNEMAAGLAEKETIKEAFGTMVDPAVRDHLLAGNVKLGGALVEATILFSDIRGFTTLAEGLSPERIVELLNRYFERMGACVAGQHGLVNKYIGDALLAVFGAPLPDPEHAEHALASAVRMQRDVRALNGLLVADGFPALRIGIGLHSDLVLAGNIGSAARQEYTVIGDGVNLASRMEGLTKLYDAETVISEQVLSRLPDPTAWQYRFLDKVRVKGKNEPTSVFEMLDGLTEEEAAPRLAVRGQLERAGLAYFERRFEEARDLLSAARGKAPQDPLVRLYTERVERCLAEGVGPDWDGVTSLTSK